MSRLTIGPLMTPLTARPDAVAGGVILAGADHAHMKAVCRTCGDRMCKTSPPAHRSAGTQPHHDAARVLDGVERRDCNRSRRRTSRARSSALETGQLGISGTGRGGLAALEAERTGNHEPKRLASGQAAHRITNSGSARRNVLPVQPYARTAEVCALSRPSPSLSVTPSTGETSRPTFFRSGVTGLLEASVGRWLRFFVEAVPRPRHGHNVIAAIDGGCPVTRTALPSRP